MMNQTIKEMHDDYSRQYWELCDKWASIPFYLRANHVGEFLDLLNRIGSLIGLCYELQKGISHEDR